MPNKKNSQSSPPPEELLQQRVDAMMDSKKPESAASTPPPEPTAEQSPAIDIFRDPKTAPEVSDELLKKLGTAETKTPTKTAASTSATDTKKQTTAAPQATSDSKGSQFDDAETDRAVDDIAAKEGDIVLAAEDAATRGSEKPIRSDGWRAKLKRLLKNKWTWIIVVLLLIILFALPVTRYKLLGLVIKKTVTVNVIDSKTATPVSSADVGLAGKVAKTDADGRVKLKVSPGKTTLRITKQYYKTYTASYFVGFKTAAPAPIKLTATGRQVPITVINKVTGKPLAGAEIKVSGTSAKTNAQGKATIVLPAKTSTDKATVALNGYNTAAVEVQVTSNVVSGNTFALTPNGHVYFLSNLNGSIDVVKTDLDGSNRKTVLAGTGREDPANTSLLASRDWRFLVLKTQRDTAQPALYLIDTSNDKVTAFDNSNASFNLIGWYGHDFLYDLESNTVPQSQAGHELIKSYDADHTQLNQLDQSQAEGSASSYAYQSFYNFYIISSGLVYNTQWYTYNSAGTNYDISSKSDTIRGVQPGVQNKKDYQSFPAAGLSYIQAVLYEPQSVYYAVSSGGKTTYYKFENQLASTVTSLSQSDFDKAYPTYLLSPSSNQAFWTELRDGKNTLFTGSSNAQNPKQIASLSDYAPYGWYSDSYLLVSKGGSELYIMPASGYTTAHQPLKITDYYKPARALTGYGYGYGGL